jgi:transcriptional regulator with PAS, ATPase and Fis domain
MTVKSEPTLLIGRSVSLDAVRAEIEYASRCDAKVLITGESGVGKEVVARLVHAGSKRNRAALVTVNCAALTETLLETELFGHVRGSFTGAVRDRSGVLEQAHRGTVFMDEIGETSPRMQGLLLRFLETGEIQRVGSDRPDNRVDVRVIAATNRNLLEAVKNKTFREDLYYRLNVIHLTIPPLRDRIDDLPLLLDRFLDQFAQDHSTRRPEISTAALHLLLSHAWPGNVRELRNLAERLVVRDQVGKIEPEHLPEEVRRTASAGPVVDVSLQPRRVDLLFQRMMTERESFWTAVYPLFIERDITRDDLRSLVRRGLDRTSGSYRLLIELFNMPPDDYKRFLNFLKKHQCQVLVEPFEPELAGGPAATLADAAPDPRVAASGQRVQ